jgi:hypothetical protein
MGLIAAEAEHGNVVMDLHVHDGRQGREGDAGASQACTARQSWCLISPPADSGHNIALHRLAAMRGGVSTAVSSWSAVVSGPGFRYRGLVMVA